MIKLFPYQERVVKYLKERQSSAIFLEMRLGKTICIIRAVKDIPGTKLVVCPKSVIPSWQKELEEEKVSGWHVTNYEQLKNYPYDPDILIIDESVRLKNPKAQITKFLFQHFLTVPYKILLSGNPAPNSALEYWTQMAFVNGGEWMGCKNWWQFRNRYFSSDFMGYQWFPKPGTKEKIKEALSEDAYILTRNQAGLKSRKIYEQRTVEMPSKVRKIYRKLEKDFVAQLPDGKEIEVNHLLSQLIYLQQTASGFISNQEISDFKVKELVSLLEGELKGEPVVIWTNYRWEQKMIKKALDKVEISNACINGSTPLETRKSITEHFNATTWNILIISVGCGKFGLNLSRSSTAIYFSNSYSLDDRVQSEERIVHVTKNEPLLYIDLVTRYSIQEDVIKVLRSKNRQSKYFLGEVVNGTRQRNRN